MSEYTEDELREIWVDGGPPRLDAPVRLVDYDDAWPGAFEQVAERIRLALGEQALSVAHVGSTSVPGLPAKPIIDVDLTVADSADEPAWLPDLESAGFRLVIREPRWHEHRCLRGSSPDVNLHVFSPHCPETLRHRMFRDHLRNHPEDRDRYAAVKRDLAARTWTYQQDYTDAKTAVIEEILHRAGWSTGRGQGSS